MADHFGDPLAAGSYALLSSSVATGVLGLVYWVIAARVYEPDDLGRASAVLATVMLTTNLVSAGFKRGVLRFLPGAGAAQRSLMARTYLVAVAASVVGALVVAALVLWWSLPGWDDVRGRWMLLAVLAAIPIWAVFTLQDAVLIALRRPWLVPGKNVAFSVAKLALVAVLAPIGAVAGVVGSWSIPALIAVVVVPIRLGRSRPVRPTAGRTDDRTDDPVDAQVKEPSPSTSPSPSMREMLSFTGAEHLGVVLWRSATLLLPVVVLARVDAAAAAGFYLADQVTYGVYIISSNVADSAVAVAAGGDEAGGRKAFRSAARLVALLVGVAVGALLLVAGPVMGVFGSGYRDETTALLILLALAAVPNAFTTLVIGLAHVRRRLRPVVLMQAMMAAGTLGGAWLLVGGRGVTGVGVAYLLTQSVVAVVAFWVGRKLLSPSEPAPARTRR
ncbi:hypothetical protein BH23ACT2_BH23ACT2_31010 [soil metagenome]